MSSHLRRTFVVLAGAALVAGLSGCSTDLAGKSATPVAVADESASEEPDESPTTEDVDESPAESPTEGTEDSELTVSQAELEEKVAATMDELTGTEFPVECDGDLMATVGATQRCWRILDGLADQGVPEGSRLGIDAVVSSVDGVEAKFDIQADDAITPPEG